MTKKEQESLEEEHKREVIMEVQAEQRLERLMDDYEILQTDVKDAERDFGQYTLDFARAQTNLAQSTEKFRRLQEDLSDFIKIHPEVVE